MKMSKNYMNLTEATIKALQGTLLNESLNVSLQDDGSTVVDTEEATVIVQERQSAEEIVNTTPVPVEEPVNPEECPECIEVPQDVETAVEEPAEDLDESKELKTETTEESKKITESISYSDSIISALEDGLLEWEAVCRECLTCMSEDDIADMIQVCDWESVISTGNNEEEFDESKKVIESLKYNKESFSKAVETYLKNKNKKIESFKATKVLTKEGKIKIKGIMTEANNKRTLISLEMNQIRKGKTYEKYELINSNGILLENKNNTCTSVLIDIKDKVLECRNLITKNK